jgi:hypothetical protein
VDALNCYIEHDHITNGVKVWLFREEQGGVVYMWPTHRTEHGDMVWMQEIVPDHQVRPDTVRPAIEMAGWMWKPFIEAIRAADGEVPAGKLLFETLKREQNRVDALIHALIKGGEPQWIIGGPTEAP